MYYTNVFLTNKADQRFTLANEELEGKREDRGQKHQREYDAFLVTSQKYKSKQQRHLLENGIFGSLGAVWGGAFSDRYVAVAGENTTEHFVGRRESAIRGEEYVKVASVEGAVGGDEHLEETVEGAGLDHALLHRLPLQVVVAFGTVGVDRAVLLQKESFNEASSLAK